MQMSKSKFFFIAIVILAGIASLEYILSVHFHLGNSASYNILTTFTSFAVILLIMIQLQRSKQGRKTDITQRFNAIIDYDLSKKYTALTKHITHIDLEIFKFPALNKMYRSPSFTPLGKQAKIFINENFFDALDDNEREALVFHEIHHVIRKDASKTYILALTILLMVAVSLIVLIQFWLSGFHFLFIISVIVALSSIVIVILILKLHLIYSEISADTFAAQTMGTIIPVISTLKKALEIVIQYYPDKRKRYNSIYLRRKDSLEKKTHLNIADENH